MLQKIQRFGGAMFAPAMLFSISGLMVGVSALATSADIVGDLAVYGTPWYIFWAIIQRGSWTVFKRLPLLFAVALPIGLAQKQPARCCLEALVAYFAYCFFLSEIIKLSGDNLGLKYPSSLTSASGITVIDGIKTLDTGIKILMSTPLANRIAQDGELGPLLCLNELELEVTEISPRECTKRAGIKAVLDALGPDHGTVYGIGDASNDIALMEAVDVGVAMGNAPDFLKEKADYVTDSFDHDGVVTALEHFGLI